MEQKGHKEETEAEEHDLVAPRPALLPREPYTWLIIMDAKERNASERLIFYSVTEDRHYARVVPELQNKYVACCYGGLLVLMDRSSDDCSILNILTMERLQLPPLNNTPHYIENTLYGDCVISSPKMDGSCRVIFFERPLCKFWSCHLGNTEFIERELTYADEISISHFINFKGKLYALTVGDFNLMASDFSDPDLHHEQVISGESLVGFVFNRRDAETFLVESCEDLLLIFMEGYDNEVCDIKILKADFDIGEWVKLEKLGDRAVILGSFHNSFSCPATSLGMKGNAIYWVRTLFSLYPRETHLYMYDIEDKSISTSLAFPSVGMYTSLSWVSLPMNCKEKKPEQKDMSFVFEDYSLIDTNFHVQPGKATVESTELRVEKGKTQRRKDIEVISTTIVKKENLWADLHNDLLHEIFPHLCAGDTVMFRAVCTTWYSVSHSSRNTQQFLLPLKSSVCSSPLLMCPDNRAYNPINGELYSIDFPNEPGVTVRAARDGWLLMDFNSIEIFFYNPFTKREIVLPPCIERFYLSLNFSAPPTSADCLVVVTVMTWDTKFALCFLKCGDEDWTYREISPMKDSFCFSSCNAFVYEGLFYLLGHRAKLLIFDPKKDEDRVIEAPEFISKLIVEGGQQYMLESDGKLIAVFVGASGSSLYACEWNACTSKWEILESLGNVMLFVSRPLSLCKRAIVSGTGNKIYFPRVVGDGHILFYSLSTKRYHTFEMGTSYSNFSASKFYPEYNGWFMP